ncbi:hypothetical protein GCM10022420_098570 [Streptomyces iranensis]|uniref:Regulatory protein TetR n=1 Tax=Streptomyces iranensis TaxID=576784 RepID=A0A061A5N7_9ACTN|nr:hypothetical protein [Streptomyces iranensis]CDR17679.1 regulatory protein TetR [Streptomyces iranensis]
MPHALSVVWRYERTLADYLRRRFARRPEGTLRADVIAASVVAALARDTEFHIYG